MLLKDLRPEFELWVRAAWLQWNEPLDIFIVPSPDFDAFVKVTADKIWWALSDVKQLDPKQDSKHLIAIADRARDVFGIHFKEN